jgi:hypothetical protein
MGTHDIIQHTVWKWYSILGKKKNIGDKLLEQKMNRSQGVQYNDYH